PWNLPRHAADVPVLGRKQYALSEHFPRRRKAFSTNIVSKGSPYGLEPARSYRKLAGPGTGSTVRLLRSQLLCSRECKYVRGDRLRCPFLRGNASRQFLRSTIP